MTRQSFVHSGGLLIAVGALLAGLCLCAGLCAVPPGVARSRAAAETGLQWGAMSHDGLTRTFAYYVPAERPAGPVPLVLTLHGGGGSAHGVWASESGRSWKALADEQGFVLILPEGQPDPGNENRHHWNDCRVDVTAPAGLSDVDDVGFIGQLIDWAVAHLHVDPDRVYANGASNGGMMSYRLATESGDRFAAVASIIANTASPSECAAPTQPVPILIMNGTDDPLMPYDGGCVPPSTGNRGRVLSTADAVAHWVRVNRASITPTVTTLPDRVTTDRSTVTVYTYTSHAQRDGAEVVFYRIDGGGHTIPGPTQVLLLRAILGWRNQDIDGPAEIWRFFSRHARSPGP